MDKPWYQKLFSPPQGSAHGSAQARADHGDAEAQFGLGLKFACTTPGSEDYVQAAHWYRKAADQSHAMAQFNLGVMYAAGQGVAKDDAEAVVWFRKAAHLGDAGAQFNLGTRHQRFGFGLPKDAPEARIEAYKWFHLAAAQGYKGSGAACEMLNLSMTPEELADANLRVAAFVAGRSDPLPADS